MYDFIWRFFESNSFQPHGFCLMWRPDVFWTHVVADIVIALSYFSIPIAIAYLLRKRGERRYHWVSNLFMLFIVACGVTHLFGVWTMWVPSYGAEALAKLVTAMVSFATALVLWPLMPALIALPSADTLARQNALLAREVENREAAEARLRELNAELERRVSERTHSLEVANLELERARSEAVSSSKAKSEFLSNMSHEIRTPMNGVIGMLELLKSEGLDDRQLGYAEIASRSAQALMQVLNDIVDFSRIESGDLEIEDSSYEPSRLIADVGKLMEPVAEAKGLTLTIDTPEDFKEAVRGDGLRVRQVVTNLVSNAVKFTDEGSVSIKLSVEPAPEGGEMLRVAVADTGIGMSDEVQTRLFTRFTQADGSITRRFGGAGLGLAISKQLVGLMGGAIGVESVEGEGSEFWFVLPLARVTTAKQSGGAKGDAVRPGLRVLVVDDNAINRTIAGEMLRNAGAEVGYAASGEEAIAKAGDPFDLILMDISMPGMDGVEAMRRIRAGGGPCASIPIVALTAHAMVEDVKRHLAAGMTDHIAKPFTPDRLYAVAGHVTRTSGAASPDEACA